MLCVNCCGKMKSPFRCLTALSRVGTQVTSARLELRLENTLDLSLLKQTQLLPLRQTLQRSLTRSLLQHLTDRVEQERYSE